MGLSTILLATPMSVQARLELFQERLAVEEPQPLIKLLRIFDHICRQIRDDFQVDVTGDYRYEALSAALEPGLSPNQFNDAVFRLHENIMGLTNCFRGLHNVDLLMQIAHAAAALRILAGDYLDAHEYQRPYVRIEHPIQRAAPVLSFHRQSST